MSNLLNWGQGIREKSIRVTEKQTTPDGKVFASRVMAVLEKDGDRRVTEVARGHPGEKWSLVHSAKDRSWMGQAGVSFARGAATGAAGTAGMPLYGGQWLGEKGVEYGGRGLYAATGVGGKYFASDAQHDEDKRQEIFNMLRDKGYSVQEAGNILRRTYKRTQPGYQSGRGLSGVQVGDSRFLDRESGMRSMDKMLENVLGGMDAIGLDQGSMATFDPASVKAFAALHTVGELVGGLGAVGASRKVAMKTVGDVPGFLKKKKIADQVRKAGEDAAGAATGAAVGKEASEKAAAATRREMDRVEEAAAARADTFSEGKAQQLLDSAYQGVQHAKGLLPLAKRAGFGIGATAAIGTGAALTDTEGKTKAELYDDARFISLFAEVGRTAGVTGFAKLAPVMWKKIGEKMVGRLSEKAAAGDVNAKAWLAQITGDESFYASPIKWMREHLVGEGLDDFIKSVDAATALGMSVKPLFLAGRAGAVMANTMVSAHPANARERIEVSYREATDQINKAFNKVVGDSPTAAISDDAAPLPFQGRPDAEAVSKEFGSLQQDVTQRYRNLMSEFDQRYGQLDEMATKVEIDHTGMPLPQLVQNVLTDAASEFGEEKTVRPILAAISQLQQKLMANPDYRMTALDARELVKLLNVVKRGSMKHKYNTKRILGGAAETLEKRLKDASPALHRQYEKMNEEYNRLVGKVYRTDAYKRRSTAEDIIGSDKLLPENLQEALMRGDDASGYRINMSTFQEIANTGAVEPLARAIVSAARRSSVTRTGEVDIKNLTNFLEKNDQILSSTRAGARVKQLLAQDLDVYLKRALGRSGTEARKGFDPSAKVIDQAIKDPNKMRALIEAVTTTGGSGKMRVEGNKIVGKTGEAEVPAGLRLLQWSVGRRLQGTDKPLDDILDNQQVYNELFASNPQQLDTLMMVSRLKQNLQPFKDTQYRFLQTVKALTTDGDTAASKMETFLMAQLGTTLQKLASNLKMVLGIRTQGKAYAVGQAASLVIGVREIEHLLDLFVPASTTKKGHEMVRHMLDKDLQAKVGNRRLMGELLQFIRPALYEHEPDQFVKSDEERDTRAIDTSVERDIHGDRYGRWQPEATPRTLH